MSDVTEPQRPPAPGGISMRPAMIVVGLAALILVVFVTIGIVSTQSPAAVKHSDSAVVVPGISLPRGAGRGDARADRDHG